MTINGLASKPIVPLMQSLYKFMCRNPLMHGELPLNALMIEHSGYAALLKALFHVVVARRFDKERAVWI